MLCGDTSNQAVEICYIEYISPYISICMQILLEVVNKPKKKSAGKCFFLQENTISVFLLPNVINSISSKKLSDNIVALYKRCIYTFALSVKM